MVANHIISKSLHVAIRNNDNSTNLTPLVKCFNFRCCAYQLDKNHTKSAQLLSVVGRRNNYSPARGVHYNNFSYQYVIHRNTLIYRQGTGWKEKRSPSNWRPTPFHRNHTLNRPVIQLVTVASCGSWPGSQMLLVNQFITLIIFAVWFWQLRCVSLYYAIIGWSSNEGPLPSSIPDD